MKNAKGGIYPIHAASKRDHTSVVEILIKCKADINTATDEEGQTALHIAAMRGNLDICKLLINSKANLEITCDSWTSLHHAVNKNHLAIANELLEAGANSSPIALVNVTPSDQKYLTPLDMALGSTDKQLLIGLLKFPSVKPNRYLTLTKISLAQLNLTFFPEGLVQLSCLASLDISQNPIKSLPASIKNLVSLRDLKISHMELDELPIELFYLSNLVKLYLQFNNLHYLPIEFGLLNKLEKLNLSYNILQTLPCSFTNLTRLKKFLYEGNPLVGFPKDSTSHFSKILEYLKHLETSQINWQKCKLMIVGEENVGKTSRIYFCYKYFYFQQILIVFDSKVW